MSKKPVKINPILDYSIGVLGDTHWEAIPAARMEMELEEIVVKWLIDAPIHAFVQVGDWFHSRLAHDSDSAKASTRVTVRLAQICESKGIPFRMIKGTLTHDYHQLQNYQALETQFTNFRVINTLSSEELLPGINVLWMPEEYPTDYSNFYAPAFFDSENDNAEIFYDAIFGHGEIDVAAGWGDTSSGSERHYGGTPTHEAAFLLHHCRGPIEFGHIHTRFRYKERLGYPGSFTRWVQGESAPKGFDVLNMWKESADDFDWNVDVDFVHNSLAREYITVNANEILDVTDTIDTMVEKIHAALGSAHRLRVRMQDFNISIEDLALIRGAMTSTPSISIESSARAIVETALPEDATPEEIQVETERVSRLTYLRDQGVPGEERLMRYMHEMYPATAVVTIDEVRELTSPLASS